MNKQRVILRESHIGQIAFTDIETANGFTVIRRGGIITQNLITALRKRHNPTLFFSSTTPQSINDSHIKGHNEWVKFSNQSPINTPITQSIIPNPPLTHSGVPFYTFLKQLHPKNRTRSYKRRIHQLHNKLTAEVETLFINAVGPMKPSYATIGSIIEDILSVMSEDKNILINLCLKNDSLDYLYAHALNVTIIALNIAIAKGYNREDLIEIGTAALLHDIGMLYTDKAIRTERDELKHDDTFEIKSHPTISANILDTIRGVPPTIQLVAMQVHERENGMGYPKALKGHCIHRYAKIIAVADVYVALINDRPYRQAIRPFHAVRELISMMNRGFLEKESVKYLINYISLFPIGSVVELSNKRLAKVIAVHQGIIDQPEVSIITNEQGDLLREDQVTQTQLSERSTLSIIGTRNALSDLPDIMFGF
ncbi:MAG: HD domain-containing protein [Fibrobacterales bacterium]